MLHELLDAHRAELIERCRAKTALRTAPRPTPEAVARAVPLFLQQLAHVLARERSSGTDELARLLHPVRRDAAGGLPGTPVGPGELLHEGFTVDQLVHAYGDLQQAVTELAFERGVPVPAQELQALHRCIEQATADAVFDHECRREELIAAQSNRASAERLGFLAHEMRSSLATAMQSFSAIRAGNVAIDGATATIVERSLARLREQLDRALADVRLAAAPPSPRGALALAPLLAEIQLVASMDARANDCEISVGPVDAALAVDADRHLLFSALASVLQNAFRYTRAQGHVRLRACRGGGRVLIEVEDECCGIPDCDAGDLSRACASRGGRGLGFAVSRRAVEACGGTLSAYDRPGVGCVFTIDLPHAADPSTRAGRVAGDGERAYIDAAVSPADAAAKSPASAL